MQKFALGQFLTSRFDGSFYRMYGMATLSGTRRREFELDVVNHALSALTSLPTQKHEDAYDALDDIQSYIDNLSGNDLDGDCRAGKSGDTATELVNMYDKWAEVGGNSRFADITLPLLSDSIITALRTQSKKPIEAGNSIETKEYDGWMVHNMLAHFAGDDKYVPTKKNHFKVMVNALKHDEPAIDEMNVLAEGLKKILANGNLVILQDVGLDSQLDDYIALCIIRKASRIALSLLDKK